MKNIFKIGIIAIILLSSCKKEEIATSVAPTNNAVGAYVLQNKPTTHPANDTIYIVSGTELTSPELNFYKDTINIVYDSNNKYNFNHYIKGLPMINIVGSFTLNNGVIDIQYSKTNKVTNTFMYYTTYKYKKI